MPNAPLTGVHVVEFAGSIAGAYCARMFAIQGASVFVVGEDDDLDEHQRTYLRAGSTRAEAVDIDWAVVDVVIESAARGPVTPRDSIGADVVRVALSPFGADGPYATWASSDLVDYALSGHAYLYGDPVREPLPGPPNQPQIACGLFGFIGAMAALFDRTRGGDRRRVEVTHHETMVALHQITMLSWAMTGRRLRRMGNRYTGQGQPNGPYRCRDGWVSIVGVTTPQVESLLAVTGLMHLLDHPMIGTPTDFQQHPHLLDEPLGAWLAERPVDEVVQLFQDVRIPACPLLSPGELLDDPQLVAREFFVPTQDGSGHLVPGTPFSRSHHQDAAGSAWRPSSGGAGPLSGLRVLDLARVWAGPLCARILAELGATVTWVEAPLSRGPQVLPPSFIDGTGYFAPSESGERPWNRNGHLVKYSLGKESLAIDLTTDAGRAAFERLVPHAHVVLENFTPRVMPNLGLDENRLHELNPDLIYLTMPGYGRSGPAMHWLAYGSSVDSHAGLSSLIGYPDATPWKGGVAWPDPIAGLHACSALLASLWAGAVNGAGGCTIESAQFESTVAAVGDHVLAAQRDPSGPTEIASPVFLATRGDDAWIAVEVGEDVGRAADDDEMADLAATAADGDAEVLAAHLQARGVAAAPVTRAAEVLDDPHLAHRDAWIRIDQPDVGEFVTPRMPIRFDDRPLPDPAPAPTLGEHNAVVLSRHGFSEREIDALRATQTIVDRPPR